MVQPLVQPLFALQTYPELYSAFALCLVVLIVRLAVILSAVRLVVFAVFIISLFLGFNLCLCRFCGFIS